MAITQISYPPDFSPAFNPIQFVLSSDNTAECDFQYVVDLFINGVVAVRLKAFAEGDNDYGYVRVEEIIQDYLSNNYHEDLVGFAQNKQSIVSYFIQVRERYNTSATCTGASTLSSVLFTSTTRYAFNGALSYEQFARYSESDYTAVSTDSKFLTNMPSRIKIPSNAYFNLSFLQDPDDPIDYLAIRTFDRYDTLIGTYLAANTFNLSSPAVPSDYSLSVGVGPEQLNYLTLAQGSQPIYHSNVHYYEIYLVLTGWNRKTEVKTFEIDSRCSKYTPYRLWFWNRLGGYDSYTFPLKRLRRIDINRSLYEQVLDADYSLGDRGDTVLSIIAQEGFVFASDNLTTDEGLWLKELFTSPDVFLYVPAETETVSVDITGVVHRSSNQTADFVLSEDIPIGTEFHYEVSGGSIIGMANSGDGTIVSDLGSSTFETDVPSTINSGALITGVLTYTRQTAASYRIPLIVTNTSYEEQEKNIKYRIEARPAHRENIQRQ